MAEGLSDAKRMTLPDGKKPNVDACQDVSSSNSAGGLVHHIRLPNLISLLFRAQRYDTTECIEHQERSPARKPQLVPPSECHPDVYDLGGVCLPESGVLSFVGLGLHHVVNDTAPERQLRILASFLKSTIHVPVPIENQEMFGRDHKSHLLHHLQLRILGIPHHETGLIHERLPSFREHIDDSDREHVAYLEQRHEASDAESFLLSTLISHTRIMFGSHGLQLARVVRATPNQQHIIESTLENEHASNIRTLPFAIEARKTHAKSQVMHAPPFSSRSFTGHIPPFQSGYGSESLFPASSNPSAGDTRGYHRFNDSGRQPDGPRPDRLRSSRNTVEESDRRPYPCVYHKWNGGEGDPTPHCRTFQSYVSRLAPHHRSRHPRSFQYCTKCFRTDFANDREVSDHRISDRCSFRCVTEGCRNYDVNPPYVNLCTHGLLNSQRFIWKKLYRLAHGLDPSVSIPDPGFLDDQSGESTTAAYHSSSIYRTVVTEQDQDPSDQFAPNVGPYADGSIIPSRAAPLALYPLPPPDNSNNVQNRSQEFYECLVRLAGEVWPNVIQANPVWSPYCDLIIVLVGTINQPIVQTHLGLTSSIEILNLSSLLRTYNHVILNLPARTHQLWCHIARETRTLLPGRLDVPSIFPWGSVPIPLHHGIGQESMDHHNLGRASSTNHRPTYTQQPQRSHVPTLNIVDRTPRRTYSSNSLQSIATSSSDLTTTSATTFSDACLHPNPLYYLPNTSSPTPYDRIYQSRRLQQDHYQQSYSVQTTYPFYHTLSVPQHGTRTIGSRSHTSLQSYPTNQTQNDSGFASFGNAEDKPSEDEEEIESRQ